MKTILRFMILTLFAITSISAETQQECTKKAMDTGAAEVKLCDPKKGDERKACRETAKEKLSAEKKACFDAAKKAK
jgi:hypothetical protein